MHIVRNYISNNLTLHLLGLKEQKKKIKPKISRRKEIIKIRVEINERQEKEQKGPTKLKADFFEKIETDKPLARLRKRKTQIKLEMQKEILKLLLHKFMRPQETIMNNYMLTN